MCSANYSVHTSVMSTVAGAGAITIQQMRQGREICVPLCTAALQSVLCFIQR